jgi:hypothetical protein
MRQVPNIVSAEDYMRRCRSTSGDWQSSGDTWVPARRYNVGWNWLDAWRTRFKLAWLVFTGKADALTYD